MKDKTKENIAKRLIEQLSQSGAQMQVQIGDGNTQTMNVGAKVGYEGMKETLQEDVKPVKDSIMEYVGRLKPVVREGLLESYDSIWQEILELEEVKATVYNRGRQQGTVFNRNFVANIVHLMVVDGIVVRGTNDVQLAELLEPEKGKAHPVRNSLALQPEIKVKKAIEGLFERLGVKVVKV